MWDLTFPKLLPAALSWNRRPPSNWLTSLLLVVVSYYQCESNNMIGWALLDSILCVLGAFWLKKTNFFSSVFTGMQITHVFVPAITVFILLCLIFSPSSNSSLPPLFSSLSSSASLFSPARKTNCPVVFRACWAITMRWKSQSVTHIQRSAVNLRTARLPQRRNWAPLCLLGTSVASVAVAVARAISGLLWALLQVDLHPSPRNAQHSAAKGATAAVAAAATVVRDTAGRDGRRSRANTAEVQNTQSHTRQVLRRAPSVPQAAAAAT